MLTSYRSVASYATKRKSRRSQAKTKSHEEPNKKQGFLHQEVLMAHAID
ncbi:hypothetical protein HMPREF1991_03093 [Hoylesella loescheii DSM 19665 = JCM 12249 = ATCC 15930]|uniref:Uncharacterized protein n=1 Tax=Hoylesella loescheii DSM 19665 = JCM 12249 = ATCC 15930 TaxID=1122985 RepID=A0A069QDV9_HOYLO|nr:hypothetical protein HMPREF1991_03093 [Hoylesella loescheii DSM 19665 = JCM 12249 = ATCC 15930]